MHPSLCLYIHQRCLSSPVCPPAHTLLPHPGARLNLISFKPSWANPLTGGAWRHHRHNNSPRRILWWKKRATTTHHMPDRAGTRRLPPLPLCFLVSSVCHSLSLSPKPPSSSLSSCHLPSPPTHQRQHNTEAQTVSHLTYELISLVIQCNIGTIQQQALRRHLTSLRAERHDAECLGFKQTATNGNIYTYVWQSSRRMKAVAWSPLCMRMSIQSDSSVHRIYRITAGPR